MKIRSLMFFITLVVLFSSSSVYAFEYFDDFERYEIGSENSKEYNNTVASNSPVVFGSGFSKKLVSINNSVNTFDGVIPDSPRNPKVEIADPSKLRTGDCINCVMQFSYSGSPDLQEDAWSEQRFSINPQALPVGKKGLTEIWLQYDQYIPENFHHRDPNPDYKSGFTQGRKVLALFGDGYSKPYPTYVIGANYRRNAYTGLDVVPDASHASQTFFWTNAEGVRRNYQGLGVYDVFPGDRNIPRLVIDPRIEKGHWQRKTLHLKLPTSASSNDGIIEFWVQRLVDTASPITAKIIDVSSGDFYDPIRPYINGGYLLGYTNDGYNEDVTYLIDNFILSNDIKSIDSSAIDDSIYQSYPPNAPSSLLVD